VTDGPLIVQSDKTLLLEIGHPDAPAARANIAPFAELERSPEHIHTYRITPLALWNARAAGHDAEQVVDALVRWSRFPVPQALLVDVVDTMSRYGRLVLQTHPTHGLIMVGRDKAVLEEILRNKKVAPMIGARIDEDTVLVHPSERGRLKQTLLKVGWPAEDEAGYVDGEAHPIQLDNANWTLRGYQSDAVEGFWAGGSGVVVLPCGAGKTLVGAAAMAKAGATTLILVTNTVSGRQWRRELLARTTLTEEEIGEYSGERKEIRPVTIATYQVMTRKSGGVYRHLDLFDSRDWGLVIYDEVHLLPAPVFRMTADLQSRRRLGLTATLVREDGREGDVFSLIGPKRFDAPWKDIEAQGWIAPAECIEVRVTLTDAERLAYAVAEPEERYKIAATARTKMPVVQAILNKHKGEPTLVIGAYLDQLEELGAALDAPIIQGSTKNVERERLYDGFRTGEIPTLVVSKVANFSIDLPEATIASRCPGPSAHDRRRRSVSAGCSVPRAMGGRHTSTPSWPATLWTPTTRRTASASWPNRATPTASWTPRTSNPADPSNTQHSSRKLPDFGSIMGNMKKNSAEAKLLVVDDEPNIRELLSTSLRFAGFEVVSAGNGREALAAVEAHAPDLAVLDVMLPDMDGFTVTRRLRAAGKHFPVLFLTAKDDTEDKVTGLTVGGDDYVTKPFSLDEVVARIRAVLRRTQPLLEDDEAVIRVDDLELDDDAHEVRRGGKVIELSPTEFKLLRYLMLNPNRVLSKAQILDHVWEYDFNGDASIVESYISYLRRKVDIDPDAPALIQTKRGVGYVLRTAEKR